MKVLNLVELVKKSEKTIEEFEDIIETAKMPHKTASRLTLDILANNLAVERNDLQVLLNREVVLS